MLRFGMRPHDMGIEDACAIAPSMNKIEPQYPTHAQADEPLRLRFVFIFRVNDCAAVLLGPEVAIGKAVGQTDYLAAPQPLFPALRTETMGEVYQDPNLGHRTNIVHADTPWPSGTAER